MPSGLSPLLRPSPMNPASTIPS
ncbi:Protein of unknown function [Pyronema omphalodes CBS 100304]|uniref:Uncharacterized protein n=1 Tax=Pyronema omphalodes (strain CBS 100304) TaxID=1076935 RepID=U4KVW0_PYROM|nr:Protein of unknown function [Pyronema omphalodes CBS 100304]